MLFLSLERQLYPNLIGLAALLLFLGTARLLLYRVAALLVIVVFATDISSFFIAAFAGVDFAAVLTSHQLAEFLAVELVIVVVVVLLEDCFESRVSVELVVRTHLVGLPELGQGDESVLVAVTLLEKCF